MNTLIDGFLKSFTAGIAVWLGSLILMGSYRCNDEIVVSLLSMVAYLLFICLVLGYYIKLYI